MKADFFIVGAAKAGTSSLWQYLKLHEKILMPDDELTKEPAYFSRKKGRINNWDDYCSIFKKELKPDYTLIGEATTYYLTDPDSPRLIFAHNPKAKIIIMLRNPTDRAYSLYNWMVLDGYEYVGNFEKALEHEEKRVNKVDSNFWKPSGYYQYLYYRSGLYSEQVKRYLDLFGENVLIIKFEDFVKDTVNVYEKICQFLGIKANKFPRKIFNPSYEVYSAKLQFILRKIIIIQILFFNKKYSTKFERDKLLQIGFKQNKIRKMSNDIRQKLLEAYEKDILKLEQITKLNFSEWRK